MAPAFVACKVECGACWVCLSVRIESLFESDEIWLRRERLNRSSLQFGVKLNHVKPIKIIYSSQLYIVFARRTPIKTK